MKKRWRILFFTLKTDGLSRLLPQQLYPDNSKWRPYLCFWSNASWPEREPQNLPFLHFRENVFLCISLKKWLPEINSWYLYLFQKDVIYLVPMYRVHCTPNQCVSITQYACIHAACIHNACIHDAWSPDLTDIFLNWAKYRISSPRADDPCMF